jgi:RNA polymerase sigma-70 factor (ECF subfamily)
MPRTQPDPGSEVASRAALRHAFESLPAAQRAVVALHLYLGYSLAETSDMVGAPLETVRSRLRLAREQLRFQLGEAVR